MISLAKLVGSAVFAPKKGNAGVFERIGKLKTAVCSPEGTQVVGFLVKRPDIAGMIKRPELFVALDSISPCDGGLMVTRENAYDEAACSRLGLNWNACIIWSGMDARTQEGKALGYVDTISFDQKTGAIESFYVGDGGVARSLVGSLAIPASMLIGYAKGAMVVDSACTQLELTGGVAAQAGEAYARAKAHGSNAVDKGSRALGKQLGKTKGMFSAFMEEYKKASK